ncbi:MAG: LapA family protein [Roseiflexus sp.]
MRVIMFILMTILSVMLVLFGVQNPQPVEVRLLTFTSGPISLSLVMILAVIAGATLVGLFTGYSGIRHALRERRLSKIQADLERRIAQLEKENEQLRAQAPQKEPVEEKRN